MSEQRLRAYKKELRELKHQLSEYLRRIEQAPKEIEQLKSVLVKRKEILLKEQETSGYLTQQKKEILETLKQTLRENPKLRENPQLDPLLVEKKLNQQFNLEMIMKSVDYLESEIRKELFHLEGSQEYVRIKQQRIEELEESIRRLEPRVKSLREIEEEDLKKLKRQKNLKLIKAFDRDQDS